MSSAEHKIRNIFVYLIPLVIGNVMPFLTLPIITRFLTPEDFGISALAMSSTLIVVSFLACNVDAATQRYYFEYRKNPQELNELINSSLIFLFVVLGVSVPFVYYFSSDISKIIMGSDKYSPAVFISYLSGCMSVLMNFYLILFRNMEKAKAFSMFKTAQAVINAVLILVFIVGFKLGYMGLIYATFGSYFVISISLVIRFMAEFPFSFNPKMLLDNLKFGIPLLPNLFTSSIYQFFDKYMLRSIISLSSTGIFSIAQNISGRLFVVMTAVQSTFDPIFMRDMFDKKEAGASSVGRNFTLFTYISLAAVLAAALFGEEIIYILAPRSYYGAINVFMILLGGVSTQTFGKIVGSQLAYAKKAYLAFPITVVGLIVNVSLNLFLIPRWQASGAAFATFLTVITMNTIFVKVSQKYYRIIYDRESLIYIYAVLFLSIFLLIYMRHTGADIWLKYSVKLVGIASYAAIGVKSGILTKENLNIIFRILTFKKTTEKYVEV